MGLAVQVKREQQLEAQTEPGLYVNTKGKIQNVVTIARAN